MKSWLRLLSPVRNVDSLIAAAGGIAIIYFFTRHGGIGVSPDSVTYISVARNLTAGKGLVTFYGTPLVDFPFFYPFFLGVISWFTHLDTLRFGPVLNEILFGITLYGAGCLVNSFQPGSGWFKRIILSCFVLSPCLLEVYSMIWSETIFLLLILIFFAVQYEYSKKHSWYLLIALAIVAATAGVTRYAGIALIGTGGILVLLDITLPLRKRLIHGLIFGSISFSFLSINLWRNSTMDGTFTGNRQKGITPLSQNIYFFGSIIGDWFGLPSSDTTMALVIGWMIIIILTLSSAWFLFYRIKQVTIEKTALIFATVYTLFMILSSTFSRYEQINSRLLAALFIPLVWMIGSLLLQLIKKSAGRNRLLWIGGAILLVSFFQYHQWKADYETYDGVKDAGIPGYTEDPWKLSPTVQYLEKNPSIFQQGRSVYSNAADAIYFFTGQSSLLLAQKAFPQQIDSFYAAGNHYLVWFNETGNDALLDLPEILQHKKMKCLQQFSDGAIYLSE